MLYTIITVLLALWLIGLLIHLGGALIHLLLVVAVVLFLYRLVSGSNPGSGTPKVK
ncbi:MAG TPA: lmo0937 family membrane protein [Candidatus Saccharimonadia bacterium]|nr:lmo0937 family membrane protein [Candidatus Saccharimonadia bacterium]